MLVNAELCVVFSPRQRETTLCASCLCLCHCVISEKWVYIVCVLSVCTWETRSWVCVWALHFVTLFASKKAASQMQMEPSEARPSLKGCEVCRLLSEDNALKLVFPVHFCQFFPTHSNTMQYMSKACSVCVCGSFHETREDVLSFSGRKQHTAPDAAGCKGNETMKCYDLWKDYMP